MSVSGLEVQPGMHPTSNILYVRAAGDAVLAAGRRFNTFSPPVFSPGGGVDWYGLTLYS